MISTLARASLRHFSRHPWQALLAALGIALGVAVVTAIDLTEVSAKASFQQATESIVGRTTHQIVGGPMGLDESLYTRLRLSGRANTLAPVIEAQVRVTAQGGSSVQLIGVDPIVEAPLRGYWSALGSNGSAVPEFITRPDTAFITRAVARRLMLEVGEQLAITHGGMAGQLEVIGILEAQDNTAALAATELLIVDIATAQELLGMTGRLSRIDLILETPEAVAAVRDLLTEDTELVNSATRTQAVAGMTQAFHTNLAALSLLALLVGMFLIYNSQTFMVIQRRQQIGILRALGVQRRQVALMVLTEAILLGVLGSVVGLLLGTLLAGGLISLVSQTINDLYFSLSIAGVRLDWASLLKGMTLGTLGAVVATLIPAYEATRVAPHEAMSRAELEGRAGNAVNWAAGLGLLLIAVSAIMFMLPGPQLLLGFIGLFLFILGSAMISPWITVRMTNRLQRFLAARRWLSFRLSARGVDAAISRTGVAVSALMLAVATTIGVGIMVDSFRHSVSNWLSTVLRADYYVTLVSSPTPGAASGLTTNTLAQMREIAGVTDLSHVRRVNITSDNGVDQLAVYQLTQEARKGFRLKQGRASDKLWTAFENEDAVLVSEPYAYRHKLELGSRLRLRTDTGLQEFRVDGVYQDYASDRGIVAMSRSTYDRYWSDNGLNGIGIYVAEDFDAAGLHASLNDILGPQVEITVVSNREIREESLRVFDRTFTITEVLRLLAGIIAFIGVFSALMAIQLERSKELGILKALGFTPAQIRRVIIGETAIIGSAAGLLAMPVGMAMAALLVFVINQRSFGWSMSIDPDLSIFASGLVLALIAALLAGVYPAARMAKTQPAAALRTE